YYLVISTSSDFSTILLSSHTQNTSLTINLPSSSRYYFKISATDNAGNISPYSSTYTILIDTIPPTIIDNQGGDDIWRALNLASYDIDFNDIGGSNLAKIQLKATTGPLQSGLVLFDWTTLLDNINLQSYTSPIQLTDTMFGLLSNGTNYISVRVYDGAGNIDMITDAFYIKKDSIKPTIYDNQPGDDLWRNSNSVFYDVDFEDDGGSLIEKIQIKASTNPLLSGSFIFDWTDFITVVDSNSYTSNFQIPQALWVQLPSTKTYISFRVFDYAGNITVSTDTFYVKKDTTPPSIPNLSLPYNGYISSSSLINFSWTSSTDDVSGINYYELYISTSSDFSTILSSASASTNSITLNIDRSFYWKVRAFDNAGNYSLWSSTFVVYIDTIPPQIVDNQVGDEVWRSVNDGLYDIDFFDNGGSHLSKVQLKAHTQPQSNGSLVFNWTDLITDINLDSYTASLTLTADMFNQLYEGTNYISIRVYDNAGNFVELSDVFYIKKDIIPPTIYDNQVGDDMWRTENTGVYNVDFYDQTSYLDRFEVKITTGPQQTGTTVVDWSVIVSAINQSLYNTDWKITDTMFNLLPVGKNYVSVRVYDNAGNVSISTDVFYIQKDTMPVTIINNETPTHYAVWLNTNSLYYNIDAQSSGASPLDRIEVAVSTSGYNIEPYLVSWTTAVSGINSQSYTTDWKIPDEVFDNMVSYTTNYVSVRVYNQAGSKTTLSDAFYVLKDTISPDYQNNIVDEYRWRNSYTGTYDVDFIDLESGVRGFEVMASTHTLAQYPLTEWVVVSSDIFKNSFTTNWSLPQTVFEGLIEDTTNYISIRVYDVAANTATFYDVFRVFKDTTPPIISDNETGDYLWRSAQSGYYDVDFYDSGGSK
ncbi:MAG: hypothetical protein QXO21_06645, partial [Candidatus Anstonellales archaeon]